MRGVFLAASVNPSTIFIHLSSRRLHTVRRSAIVPQRSPAHRPVRGASSSGGRDASEKRRRTDPGRTPERRPTARGILLHPAAPGRTRLQFMQMMAQSVVGYEHGIPMINTSQEPGIDRQIVEIVRAHWKESRTPLLLSQIGSRISREDAASIRSEYQNLAAYLREALAADVQILQSDKNPTIIAAAPAEEEFSGDVDAMLSLTQRRRPETSSPRFHPAFWAAFIKELDPQERRYVSKGPPPRFRDLPAETKPSGAIEVAREYIVGTDDDVDALHGSIGKWLGENNLDENDFLANIASQHKELPSDDLLGRLVTALTPEELKRLSMPLDIVGKLRRQSV